jgi:hypothetical protein
MLHPLMINSAHWEGISSAEILLARTALFRLLTGQSGRNQC